MARPKVLMACCSESGHSNVFLATAHSLLSRHPSVELHVASFQPLEKSITASLKNVKCEVAPRFHLIDDAPTTFEALNRDPDPSKRFNEVVLLPPGRRHMARVMEFFVLGLPMLWTVDEWTAIFRRARGLILEIRPDAVVCDALLGPAVSAARHLREREEGGDFFRLAVLSPNSLKEFTQHLEGGAASFAKWPIVGSALPMPLPWYLVPLNFYYLVRLVLIMMGGQLPRYEAQLRESTGLPGLEMVSLISVMSGTGEGLDRILLSSSPETDFPNLNYDCGPQEYRDRLVSCGPILRSTSPVSEVDPELDAWLGAGPVVYVNLGTLCMCSEAEAVELAKSFRKLFDHDDAKKEKESKLRVLWKLKKDPKRGPEYGVGPGSAVHAVIGKEMDEDRVRVVGWLDAEPASILMTGNVVVAVTHGGASSYYEPIV